jgi:hypothetical protein
MSLSPQWALTGQLPPLTERAAMAASVWLPDLWNIVASSTGLATAKFGEKQGDQHVLHFSGGMAAIISN